MVQGLKGCLAIVSLCDPDTYGASLEIARLRAAADMLLSYQNSNGGWPTYELMRSFALIEIINPAETFGGIMVDYSYVECSSAAMTALCAFRKVDPMYRSQDIQHAMHRGLAYVKRIQRPDGSWYGSWGVCFTYGMFFGCKVLRAAGMTVANCAHQRRAVAFLKSVQRPDGGWGESYLSCQDKRYSHLDGVLIF
jgi:cycloartenol synthase